MDRYTRFKVACALSRSTVSELAKQWGVLQPNVTQVAQGIARSRNIEAKIDAFCSQVLRQHGIDLGRKAA